MRIAFVFLFALMTLTASAQEYGHVNFGNLLAAMPEVAAGESELQAYEKQLTAQGRKMAEELQAFVNDVQAKAADTTPKVMSTYRQQAEQKQAALRKFEQEAAVNLDRKRQEILGPIIQRAKDAVQRVSKARGYALVFDSSIFGNILFATEATDLTPAVLAELGVEPKEE